MVAPGEMTQRITILEPIYNKPLVGEANTSYRAAASVWAKVSVLSARTIAEFKQAQLKATIAVTIYYVDWLTVNHRIQWNDVEYWIEGTPIDQDNRHEQLTFTCSRLGSE